MRKIFTRALIALLTFLCLSTPFTSYMVGAFWAKAETSTTQIGDYACVLTEDVFFCATANEQDALFCLPPTYYVHLLEYSPIFCKVEYQADSNHTKRLVGYVKTEQLTFVPYVPKRPYLTCVFDVEYKLEEGVKTEDGFLTQITMRCAYYGDYQVGSTTYCYVLREGEFGYVPKPANLYLSKNTEYEEYLSTLSPSTEEGTAPKTKNNTPAQVAILIALCLLVPLLAALILKPKSTHDPE